MIPACAIGAPHRWMLKLPHSHVRSNWSINFKQKFLIISHPTCSAERISPNRRIYSLYHCLFTRGRINAFCTHILLSGRYFLPLIIKILYNALLHNFLIIIMKCNKATSAKIVFGFFNTIFFVSTKILFDFLRVDTATARSGSAADRRELTN